MVGPKDRIEGSVGVVGHVGADPSVKVVVSLLIEPVEIGRAVWVKLIRLRRIESWEVGPWIAWPAFRLAEGGESHCLHHLRLEQLHHTDLFLPSGTMVIPRRIKQRIPLHPPASIVGATAIGPNCQSPDTGGICSGRTGFTAAIPRRGEAQRVAPFLPRARMHVAQILEGLRNAGIRASVD